MLFLSAELCITTALPMLWADLFHPHFTERKLKHRAEYTYPSRGQRPFMAVRNQVT